MEGLCPIFQEARIKQKVFNWNSKHSISILFIFVLTGNSIVRYEYLYSKQCLFAKVRTNCMKLERLYVPNNIKIILQIAIFVVWLTDFLSYIRNLINPPWWFEQILLSMKRCENSCKDVWHIDEQIVFLHAINSSFRNILSRDNFKSKQAQIGAY